ncbi:hypothetical protein HID58_021890, partial [Brassica napus]
MTTGMAGFGEEESGISDSEIIEGFLRPKIEGEAVAIPGLIVELGEELYTREPWLLPQTAHPILNPREWLYLGKPNRNNFPSPGETTRSMFDLSRLLERLDFSEMKFSFYFLGYERSAFSVVPMTAFVKTSVSSVQSAASHREVSLRQDLQ